MLYEVITHGYVAALADHIAQEAKKLTGRPASVEGMPNADSYNFV